MGWFGYGLYDGDDTQTQHIDFIKRAIPSLSEDEIVDNMLGIKKTSIPEKYHVQFRKGIPAILKKIKAPKNLFKWDEDKAIEWQMLLSLFVDNNLSVPKEVLINGMLACHFLLGEHADDFNSPSRRRASIKRFMKKVNDNFCTVKARQEINKRLK
jgi:hypothetical protein